jgi:hypothetical protein
MRNDSRSKPVSYGEYLRGLHWRRLRMRIRRETDCCELCGWRFGFEISSCFEVHHWSYKNIPHELRDDLGVLCPACHSDVHVQLDGGSPDCIRVVYQPVNNDWHFCWLREVAIDRDEFMSKVFEKYPPVVRDIHELGFSPWDQFLCAELTRKFPAR